MLTAFLVTAVQSSAFAKQFTIVNNSGETVYAIYCVPTSWGGWGDDILVNPSTLPNGYKQTLELPDSWRYVKVKCYFSGDRYKYWDSLDMSRVGWVEVTPYRG